MNLKKGFWAVTERDNEMENDVTEQELFEADRVSNAGDVQQVRILDSIPKLYIINCLFVGAKCCFKQLKSYCDSATM